MNPNTGNALNAGLSSHDIQLTNLSTSAFKIQASPSN
jgi:hypothetical protein